MINEINTLNLLIRWISYSIMRKLIEVINKRNQLHNPKNGSTRIKTDAEGTRHLETFQNGSWRYSRKLAVSNSN